MSKRKQYDDLREACVQEAIAIIETDGVERLSLREVSRRLGVSHQAPYKHFASRDHILAEVVRRMFDDFAAHLDRRPQTGDPQADLRSMGHAYLSYALAHPLQYRLMFGAPLPNESEHPEMMASAQHAFALLRDNIARTGQSASPEMDAMFVWSTMHGIVSILQTQAATHLDLSEASREQMIAHVLGRIDTGLSGTDKKGTQ